jgi:4-amino-4-deoxy-L-arabinose transferase-like glycosyltransferase
MTLPGRLAYARWKYVAIAALLCVLLFEVASSIRRQSTSWDEGDHLFAGYMSLKHDDFSLNPEHPPLAKMVAALPLLPLDLKVAPSQGRYFKDEAYYGGRELLYRNGPANGGRYSASTLLFRARLATSVFVLGLGLLVFLAGEEMFGAGAGLLALAFFVFEPSILTNGAYVATDMCVSCFYFATIYALYRYLRRPSWWRVGVVGITAGLCLSAKHSSVLLLPMFVVLLAGEAPAHWHSGRKNKALEPAGRCALRLLGMFAVVTVMAVTILWAFYGFRYSMRPGGVPMSPSLSETASTLPAWQDHAVLTFAHLHLLPESWLYGLVDVQRVADFMPTFILGKVYSHGVWFYFPVVFSLKWTIGALGLLALALYAAASGKLRRPREVFFLATPVVIYFAVAMASGLDIGERHILPTFAFLLVLAAGGAWALVRRNRRWGWAVGLLLLAHIVSSARSFPDYLPYANELWGGPAKTHLYLTDSNTDWGQQLVSVKAYIDEHHITRCYFAYFVAPFILPSDYGIPCTLLPTFDTGGELETPVPPVIQGPVFISYGTLNGFEFGASYLNPYQRFMARRPDAVIRNGVAVYNGTYAVPLASALLYVERAKKTMRTDPSAALANAEQAVHLDPEGYEPDRTMGDALAANGQKAQAQVWYQRAKGIAER